LAPVERDALTKEYALNYLVSFANTCASTPDAWKRIDECRRTLQPLLDGPDTTEVARLRECVEAADRMRGHYEFLGRTADEFDAARAKLKEMT
jgi:hypothetical protein